MKTGTPTGVQSSKGIGAAPVEENKRMRSPLVLSLFVVAASAASAAFAPPASAHHDHDRRVRVHERVFAPAFRLRIAPPAPRVEVRVARPSPRHVWINGYWGWEGGRHVWFPGRWDL